MSFLSLAGLAHLEKFFPSRLYSEKICLVFSSSEHLLVSEDWISIGDCPTVYVSLCECGGLTESSGRVAHSVAVCSGGGCI